MQNVFIGFCESFEFDGPILVCLNEIHIYSAIYRCSYYRRYSNWMWYIGFWSMLIISLLVEVMKIIETQRSMQVRRPVYMEIQKKNIHVFMSCYQRAEK
jgi:hypothetical protein